MHESFLSVWSFEGIGGFLGPQAIRGGGGGSGLAPGGRLCPALAVVAGGAGVLVGPGGGREGGGAGEPVRTGRTDLGADRRRAPACRGLVIVVEGIGPGADGDRNPRLRRGPAGLPGPGRGAGPSGLGCGGDRPEGPRPERGGAHLVRRP